MSVFHGEQVTFNGSMPAVGDTIPDFLLEDTGLQTKTPQDFSGKRLILNIFPSVDTGVCAASVRSFNKSAADISDAVAVLCISKDLPFAHGRFCAAEGIEKVVSLSTFRDSGFGERYGLEMSNTKLAGLLGRAVLVTDENHTVIYSELVPDIGQEPDYAAALKAAQG